MNAAKELQWAAIVRDGAAAKRLLSQYAIDEDACASALETAMLRGATAVCEAILATGIDCRSLCSGSFLGNFPHVTNRVTRASSQADMRRRRARIPRSYQTRFIDSDGPR